MANTHRMAPYQPVSCALHSAMELAVMRRKPVILHFSGGQALQGTILDVWTSGGREWLRLLPCGAAGKLSPNGVVMDLSHVEQLDEVLP